MHIHIEKPARMTYWKLNALGLILLCFSDARCEINDGSGGYNNFNSVSRGLDARNMLTSIVSNLMSRGFGGGDGGSQVLSLNLTNLLVLVLLKALIFAAGSLGAGTWKGGYGRSSDGEERIVTDEEILLYLSYLTGKPDDHGCLQFVACKGPQQARRYAAAGEMVLRASKIFSQDSDPSYENILEELREASNIGLAGGDCSRYFCGENIR